jgi:hypothetical protein
MEFLRMKFTLGTEVISVNPNKKDSLRKVQGVYRRQKYHKKAAVNNNGM